VARTPTSELVSVIVPTYREAENLPILLPLISNTLTEAKIVWEVVVVDDNSQDGTDAICAELAKTYPVRLEVRKEVRGLASAVIDGMRLARGSVFVVLDADLSHPPEKIPELLAALSEEHTDFVIGSRYAPGGGTDVGWGLFRWVNSKVATLLAWPLTRARDPMAGFFAIRRSTVEAAAPLDPIGYKIGLELIVKSPCHAIREVPILFQDRTRGQSKLSIREQAHYLLHLIRLYEFRYRSAMQLLQFLLVGSSGVIVDLFFFAMLTRALPAGTAGEYVARGLAIAIAMTWNFVLNRLVTFRSARQRSLIAQYVFFCVSCSLGACINWTTFALLHTHVGWFSDRPTLAALIGIIAGTGSNFIFSKWHVFR
jgi:dolichol-phosphate mannosyltransferase